MSDHELIGTIIETIRKSTTDPAEDLRKAGQAMVAIAGALEGMSGADATCVLRAAEALMEATPRNPELKGEQGK